MRHPVTRQGADPDVTSEIRCCERRLNAGMPGPNHDDVEVTHALLPYTEAIEDVMQHVVTGAGAYHLVETRTGRLQIR